MEKTLSGAPDRHLMHKTYAFFFSFFGKKLLTETSSRTFPKMLGRYYLELLQKFYIHIFFNVFYFSFRYICFYYS